MTAMGKKRKRQADIGDVYALKKRLQVEIVFPISPFMSSEQLFTHYQRGVLPWDTYVEHACAHACLPHTKMPEPTQSTDEDQSTGNEGEESQGSSGAKDKVDSDDVVDDKKKKKDKNDKN